jgi:hypothetical protein
MMKPTFALMLTLAVSSVTAFRLQAQRFQPLNLCPGQAGELEAAASVIFAHEEPELDPARLVDDTKHHDNKSSLSASSSSKPAVSNNWWSKSFFNLVRNRGN